MDRQQGFSHRKLRRIAGKWGRWTRKHTLLIPFFHSNYKLVGFAGFSEEGEPVWYPGAPQIVEPGQFTFKSAFLERPPTISQTDPEEFSGTYYLDPERIIEALFPGLGATEDGPPARNLAGARIHGKLLQDIVYLPTLHRVRWLEVRHNWFASRRYSVMTLPALNQILTFPSHFSARKPGMQPPGGALHGSPGYSGAPKREGFLERWLRRIIQEQIPGSTENHDHAPPHSMDGIHARKKE